MSFLIYKIGIIGALITSCVANALEDFNINVNRGISSCTSATNGAVVRVFANVPDANKVFSAWAGDISGVADQYSPTTSVSVAGAEITLTATYVSAILIPMVTVFPTAGSATMK